MRTVIFGLLLGAMTFAASDADAQPARVSIGQRTHVPAPRHIAADSTDKPVVHQMRDLYQEDQSFANLFAKDGSSEICGPTAMSNVLLYMKHAHSPTFPKLLSNINDSDQNAHDVVEHMFETCHTSKSEGTGSMQLQGCARSEIKNAGYEIGETKAHGAFPEGKAITPNEARDEAKADHGVILMFGWYDRKTYKRDGGHYVALAGYDAEKIRVLYVTNPLIKDYPKDHVYSKVVLEPVAKKKGDLRADGMWQTEHLFGEGSGEVAVLEDMIVVLPKESGK
jgi:hypothetical protein